MPRFQIFAQREVGNSADLVKREIDGDEEQADEEIYTLENNGYEIWDVHVYHKPIGQQQETTPARVRRGGRR